MIQVTVLPNPACAHAASVSSCFLRSSTSVRILFIASASSASFLLSGSRTLTAFSKSFRALSLDCRQAGADSRRREAPQRNVCDHHLDISAVSDAEKGPKLYFFAGSGFKSSCQLLGCTANENQCNQCKLAHVYLALQHIAILGVGGLSSDRVELAVLVR